MKRPSAVVGVLLFCLSVGAAEEESPGPTREYRIKAAFLYNFVKFVEWQERDLGATIRICVLGTDPFGPALDALSGKTLRRRPVSIGRFTTHPGIEACHVLFVSSSEDDRLDGLLAAASKASVLTVGETEKFTHAGGVVTFVVKDGKTRFIIDDGAARRAGLKMSSKLLRLAEEVR